MLIHGCVIVSGLATFFGIIAFWFAEPLYAWEDWNAGATIRRALDAATAAAGVVTFLRGIGVI